MDQVVVFQKMFEQVRKEQNFSWFYSELKHHRIAGNDSNLLIVFYVQIMPDDFVMQLHRF
ncbi:DUF1398 family protein [Escherichia coli]|nr:DUF1398 family protein [Escherichia coli]MCS1254521.1 DUF1398 family protein [Escherichia coli]